MSNGRQNPIAYNERRPLMPGSVDPDTPTAGFYKIKLQKGAIWSPVRIWYGPPQDPVTGETMDRGWRWQALVNGVLALHIERIWPRCAEDEISPHEYMRLMALTERIDPRKAVDPLAQPIPF